MPDWLPWSFLVALFTPAVEYHVRARVDATSDEFLYLLQSTCQSELYHGNRVAIFRNGDRFYPAMLDAIRGATRSVCLECYIFEGGHWGRQFMDLLCERARAGVVVTVTVDAIGGTGWKNASFTELKEAGGRIAYYQSFKWYRSLRQLNNRTHREMLVVDGRVAFVGGAGIADRWGMRTSDPQWRDTMARVDGPVVSAIQAVFAENWLE